MFRDENFLVHHGIKGMKWGVRRTPQQLGHTVKKKGRRAVNLSRNYTGSHRSDALKRSRRKDINKMSNKDLQNDINRLRLEREYRSLTKIDISFGKNYVNEYNKYNSSVTTASKHAAKTIGYGKQAVRAMRRTTKAAAMA